MARVYNFSAGPAMLPESVLRQAQEEMLDWHGSGMCVAEMSHRGKEFMSIATQAGGGSARAARGSGGLQGAVPPGRGLQPVRHGAAEPAARGRGRGLYQYRFLVQEGHRRGAPFRHCQCGGDHGRFTLHPRAGPVGARTPGDAAYVHYTPNETIGGVEFPYVPETGASPLVADMSSTILVAAHRCVPLRGSSTRGRRRTSVRRVLTLVIVRDDSDRRASGRHRRPCSTTRSTPRTAPCTTRRPPMPGTWRDWCSSG